MAGAGHKTFPGVVAAAIVKLAPEIAVVGPGMTPYYKRISQYYFSGVYCRLRFRLS